jgi:hypothetical protein
VEQFSKMDIKKKKTTPEVRISYEVDLLQQENIENYTLLD